MKRETKKAILKIAKSVLKMTTMGLTLAGACYFFGEFTSLDISPVAGFIGGAAGSAFAQGIQSSDAKDREFLENLKELGSKEEKMGSYHDDWDRPYSK